MNKYCCVILISLFVLITRDVNAGEVLPVRISDTYELKRNISMDDLIKSIKDKKIIYIGEIHDSIMNHEVEQNIIERLVEINPHVSIAMEMFKSDSQNNLDNYLNGNISEEVFLKSIDYEEGWGFNFEFYKPILVIAKEHKLPVIALNIDTKVIKKVSANGIAKLDAQALNMLPDSIDFTNEKYRKLLEQIYKQHPHTESGQFERFYEVQLIWDEYMADIISDFLRNYNQTQLIVITGNGHIIYKYGIPSRVYRRNKIEYVTISQDVESDTGISDFLIESLN